LNPNLGFLDEILQIFHFQPIDSPNQDRLQFFIADQPIDGLGIHAEVLCGVLNGQQLIVHRAPPRSEAAVYFDSFQPKADRRVDRDPLLVPSVRGSCVSFLFPFYTSLVPCKGFSWTEIPLYLSSNYLIDEKRDPVV
jgi:hypothetical protein